jgi:hypothetical protein
VFCDLNGFPDMRIVIRRAVQNGHKKLQRGLNNRVTLEKQGFVSVNGPAECRGNRHKKKVMVIHRN